MYPYGRWQYINLADRGPASLSRNVVRGNGDGFCVGFARAPEDERGEGGEEGEAGPLCDGAF